MSIRLIKQELELELDIMDEKEQKKFKKTLKRRKERLSLITRIIGKKATTHWIH